MRAVSTLPCFTRVAAMPLHRVRLLFASAHSLHIGGVLSSGGLSGARQFHECQLPVSRPSGSHLVWCRRSRWQVRRLLPVAPLPGHEPGVFLCHSSHPAIRLWDSFPARLGWHQHRIDTHTACSTLTCCFPKGSMPSFLLETKMKVL